MMIQLTIINVFKTSETKFWEKKEKGRKSKKKKKEDINRNLRTENNTPNEWAQLQNVAETEERINELEEETI